MAEVRAESKRARDRAYRVRKRIRNGKPVSRNDARFIERYTARVAVKEYRRKEAVKEKRKLASASKAKRDLQRKLRPTKKLLKRFEKRMSRFISDYDLIEIDNESEPYGKGGVIVTYILENELLENVPPNEIPKVEDGLSEMKANIRARLRSLNSDKHVNWTTLAPIQNASQVFILAVLRMNSLIGKNDFGMASSKQYEPAKWLIDRIDVYLKKNV